jgi:replicative DNA helicase
MAELQENLRRLPPQSIEAEESVLGGILLDNTAIDRAIEVLGPDDFYREGHRRIYRAMLELSERGEPTDIITLSEVLRAQGDLATVGGATYLAELAERVPTAANIMQYARIVKEKAILRGLIGTATEIATRGYEASEDVDMLLDQAEQRIFAISEGRIRPAFYSMGEVIMETLKTVERLHEHKQMVTGVPTGFDDLDRLTAGLQPSELIILAGRPGMGKTALALNIAQHAALATSTCGVAVFSLEMAKEQLVLRMLCAQARVDSSKVRGGFLSDRDFERLAIAAQQLGDAPIYIDDSPGLSVLELRAKARRLKRDPRVHLGLVIIDYLQLMRGLGAADSREQEISQISRSLKNLAKELSVPVIALSQLNRQVEQRAERRPLLADLRESGAIEQDADVVAFVFREEAYHPDNEEVRGLAEVIVAKQRNGPIGNVRLAYRSEYTKFENYAPEEDMFGATEEVF